MYKLPNGLMVDEKLFKDFEGVALLLEPMDALG